MPSLRDAVSTIYLESWFRIIWTLMIGDPDNVVDEAVVDLIPDLLDWLQVQMLQCERCDTHIAECCYQLWSFGTFYLHHDEQCAPTATMTASTLSRFDIAYFGSQPLPRVCFGEPDDLCIPAPMEYKQKDGVQLYVLSDAGRLYLYARLHDMAVEEWLSHLPLDLCLDQGPGLDTARLLQLTKHWWPTLHPDMEHRVDYSYISSFLTSIDVYSQPALGNAFKLINTARSLDHADKYALNCAIFAHPGEGYFTASSTSWLYGLWAGFIAQLCDGNSTNGSIAWFMDDETCLLRADQPKYSLLTMTGKDKNGLFYIRKGVVRYKAPLDTVSIQRGLKILLGDLKQDPTMHTKLLDELDCFILRERPMNPQSSLFSLC